MTHTTEELIVQYLDGELVRKELETMLFERLAESPEARGILREYLTMRGAIRVTMDDERFQLSSDLDARTRLRIEHVLEKVAMEEPVLGNYAADAPAVSTNAVTRRMQRWSLRPSIAALALLLAVGATWFLTRETTTPRMAVNTPVQTQAAPERPSTENSQVTIPGTAVAVKEQALNSTPRTTRAALKPVASAPSQEMAQNTQAPATQPVQSVQPAQPQEDPADVMLSHRTAKFLNAASTEKREVVVTSRDRL